MIQVVALPDSPFHQHGPAPQIGSAAWKNAVGIVLHEIGNGMVRDLTARKRTRPDFDGSNPTWFRQSDVRRRPPPYILMMSGHRPRIGFDDDVRLPQFF